MCFIIFGGIPEGSCVCPLPFFIRSKKFNQENRKLQIFSCYCDKKGKKGGSEKVVSESRTNKENQKEAKKEVGKEN